MILILLTAFPVFGEELSTKNMLKPTGVISKSKNHAEGMNNEEVTELKRTIIDSTNLDLYLVSDRKLAIEAWTRGIEKSSIVGFKKISLQRWNGSKWVNVITPWDDLENNIQKHNLSYQTKVEGGYYYKVSLYHYAQQGTGLFANKEERFNETSYIWVN